MAGDVAEQEAGSVEHIGHRITNYASAIHVHNLVQVFVPTAKNIGYRQR